jgi:hypothetical protein
VDIQQEAYNMKYLDLSRSTFTVTNTSPISVNDELTSNRIKIKSFYPNWSGESVSEIEKRHDIKHMIRIGTPETDKLMQQDRVFFILDYIAYNPLNTQIERRVLHPQRFMGKIYVGQSIEEEQHKDAAAVINGKLVASEVVDLSWSKEDLIKRVVSLEQQLTIVKIIIDNIYRENEQTNKVSSRVRALRGG